MTFSLTTFYSLLHARALEISSEHAIDVIGVTGGRDFDNRKMISATLMAIDSYCPFKTLINGDARGLDKLAADWATRSRKIVRTLPALWKAHGNAAGPIRNNDMLELLLEHQPHSALVAFPGGSGTGDMVMRTNLAGVPVIDVQLILDSAIDG